jgi:Sec-independent protein translocase protein TatA
MDQQNPLGNKGETPLEQSHEKSPAELQHEHERTAFASHVETSEEKVPENFEDAGSWFDSLKEAQKNYTQGQQELAELKAQTQAPVVEEIPTEPPLTNELRIPTPEPQEEEQPKSYIGVDDATYDTWAMEFAAKGDITQETKNDIKRRTGFSDRMLEDYISAQKARLRESYGQAANVVGGREKLDKIFKWASNTLSEQDMQNVNVGLSSPSYEVTLRGLASMYDTSTTSAKANEPAPNPNLTQVAASQTGILPYQNQREFKAERNDPRFQLEPNYRDMVQRKMSITNWNSLPV